MSDDFIYDEKNHIFYLPDQSNTYEAFYKEKVKNNEELGKMITYKTYKFYVSENSKFIKFIDDDKEYNIFISNGEQLSFIMENFGFKKYIVLKNGVETNKTLFSFDFDTVKKVKNYLKEEEYIKANKPLNNTSNILLESLSILYDKYQKYEVLIKEFLLTEERKNFFKKLKSLLSNSNFVSICGPKSIGKTTSLLYFQKIYYSRSLYINLSYCKKLYETKRTEELYLTICKELFNCLTFQEVNQVYLFLEKQQYNSLMDLLYKLIAHISGNYTRKFFFFIIDQYKEKIDKNNDIIEQIKNTLSNNKKLYFIICNSLNEKDYRKALQLYHKNPNSFFLNYLFVNKLVTVTEKDLINLNEEEKQLLLKCGNLFQYLYKINEGKKYKVSLDAIQKDIIKEIKDEINQYYEENDSRKIINNIREIHSILDRNIPYDRLFNVLNIFPLKYFIFTIDSKDIFSITDITENSNISLKFNFPIVMESLNDILYQNKKLINSINYQTNNYLDFENDFNEFLWFSRFNYQYEMCHIKEKIEINSIVKMKVEDKKFYNFAIETMKNKNDSILIIQKEKNAQYFDTAILKLVNKSEKKYELYLFQETNKKGANERLCSVLLNTLKYYLRMLFKVDLKINIEEVHFSYVFKGESPDNTTINYCITNRINYILYYESTRTLEKSDIDDKIVSSFFYLQSPNIMIDRSIELTTLELNKKLKANEIKQEFDKLNNFLNKKRDNKAEKMKNLQEKINSVVSFDKVDFRKNNYIELLLDEELMENDTSIVGISYKIDTKTKNLLKEINLSSIELKNFLDLIKVFGDNLSILSVTKINDFGWDWVPSFRCALLAIDNNNTKIYFDIKNKISYRLNDKKEMNNLDLKSTFYMIIFANSKMIAQK